MSFKELLEHFKLEAEVYPQYTIHPSFERDHVSGLRAKVKKRWERAVQIGEGGFGTVWQELHRPKVAIEEIRAVKIVAKRRMEAYGIDFKKELIALAVLSKKEYRQANVFVSFLGWYETNESIFLAMEYFRYGDLSQHVVSTGKDVRDITVDLLDGLRIMHREGFTHRDLKPKNIFVMEKPPESPKWWVKIGDFGLSKRIKSGETVLKTEAGTAQFKAPEIFGFVEDELPSYSNAVDIWSLGCVIFAISAQRVPFERPYDVNRYCWGKLTLPEELIADKLNENGTDFVRQCLKPEPIQRTTIEQALEHAWILTKSQRQQDPMKIMVAKAGLSAKTIVQTLPKVRHHSAEPNIQSASTHGTKSPVLPAIVHNLPAERVEAEGLTVRLQAYQLRVADSLRSQQLPDNLSRKIYSPLPDRIKHLSNMAQQTWLPQQDLSVNLPHGHASAQDWKDPLILREHFTNFATISNHTLEVTTVAFSPDGKLLATGSADTTVRLWNVETGQAVSALKGHYHRIHAVEFSPDGKSLASSSIDNTILLWNVTTSSIVHKIRFHRDTICSFIFSPDGMRLAVSSRDAFIRLCNVATGLVHSVHPDHGDNIHAMAFSRDSQKFASSSSTGIVTLQTLVPPTVSIRVWDDQHDVANTLAFAPNGKLLAFGSSNGNIIVLDANTGKEFTTLRSYGTSVQKVIFFPDSDTIVSHSQNATVRFWSLRGQVTTFFSNKRFSSGIALSPDAELLAMTWGSTVLLRGKAQEKTRPVTELVKVVEEQEELRLLKTPNTKTVATFSH